MQIKDAAGAVLAEKTLPRTSSAQQVELLADVNGSSFTIGFAVDGHAGDWAVIDKVEAGFVSAPTTESDTTLPTAAIITPVDGAVLARSNGGKVSATAKDASGLAQVTADLYDGANEQLLKTLGSTASIDANEWSGRWSLPTKLVDGWYTIRFSATDLAGNVSTVTRRFRVDRKRTHVATMSPKPGTSATSKNGHKIEITVSDKGGLDIVGPVDLTDVDASK
ncbi:Ig-like domain repeat protein [Microbacterium sp. JZ70]